MINVISVPTFLLIDKYGIIKEVRIGVFTGNAGLERL